MKNLTIIGVTGSIGTQSINLIRLNKHKYNLVAISAHKSIDKVIDIIKEFNIQYVAITHRDSYEKLKDYLKINNIKCKIYYGIEGLNTICSLDEVDTVLTSVVGMVGLLPTLKAIRAKKNIALANKETLVVAGEIVMAEAKRNNVKILPVDSEHSAIFQCLQGNENNAIDKILLTASGGPFRGKKTQDLLNITPEQALKHPKWNMGKKISIDSATLMNKGLEVIEARWLFNCEYEDIQVVVHPESVIHSMVQYTDGSIMAQLSSTDMTLPIQYALNYPIRDTSFIKKLDLFEINKLTFEKPDLETFKCLQLAYQAGKEGGFVPTVLNASNEACVDMFIREKISFLQISEIIERCMDKFSINEELNIDNIINLDKKVKEFVYNNY
ncbi:1-deoxy-D-xylulose 5-phosphate reductoisomerase [Clostridium amylolyticum]|uniref:1-deoxy-D-xylulose 5-phosphate reductoisomerase n=1 Tax=Clostridium amylolyticum TaxID=1121298 RepID=A0A1M6DB05_9CLOT|nr:1-deoxy-D-xylulose-5-phosphate reductoisomerase [Clostridium amylolyticum]SHI70228.1 1-deoxy-D-xylulose 5-phosphate reductoisomerase [Clostridium amylolyticum]